MEWKIDERDNRIIKDITNRTVCYTDNWMIAGYIIKLHNVDIQHGILSQEQIDAIRDEKKG
jgi:hypothetical protein